MKPWLYGIGLALLPLAYIAVVLANAMSREEQLAAVAKAAKNVGRRSGGGLDRRRRRAPHR